jgi:hypothetical protein
MDWDYYAWNDTASMGWECVHRLGLHYYVYGMGLHAWTGTACMEWDYMHGLGLYALNDAASMGWELVCGLTGTVCIDSDCILLRYGMGLYTQGLGLHA